METEVALLWGFLLLMLLAVATVVGLLVHSGLFIPVDVKTCKPDLGEVYIAYKFARGPYKESGTLFTQVHTLLPDYRTIGVYYDDPKMKQSHKLRYIVGVVLSENGSPVVPEHRNLLEEHGYQFTTFPAIDHAVQASFPYNSTISIIVAIMKVYPALREYVETRSLCAHPFLEVYDSKKTEILFVGPLARQDDFYVPEVQQEEDDDHRDDYEDDDRTENSSRSWDESASFIRGGELNDSECSESVGDDSCSYPPPPCEAPTESSTPPSLPIPSQPDEVVETPAALPPPPPPPADTADPTEATADVADTAESASLGGEESDANTGSSFEEIDEKEAAAIPDMSAPAESRETNLKKDEDEGER
ncbi:testis-expressed protein 264 homolog isoform X1 [Homarus americanus]|uniref:Testis-expressed protein 264-like n=1 Tax=Homarus americanus TaxID=6706 RepID=A0A8J5K4Z7_HOMAM|nr:testis-expressed protein 264 homolog isoform X1 [Homarus americanus]KAG7169407.1 Testis-expressed protein 264-like [Homarus americanus]